MTTTAAETGTLGDRGTIDSAGHEAKEVGRAALEAAGFDDAKMRRAFDESRRIVRERPAVAIGGAAVAGVVVGRFARLHLLRFVIPLLAFGAGFVADRLAGQSEGPVAT